MTRNFTELAFTDRVRKVQERYGTWASYQRMESNNSFRTQLTWQESGFIQERDGFYMASVGENGWPYMQYRGGPKGFLKVIDENVLAFTDFRGNGQYISTGNLEATKKAVLFLMDYVNKQRLKIWAEVDVLHAEDHPELLKQVDLPGYEGHVERILVFRVQAFDWNCPQHITQRYTRQDVMNGLLERDDEAKASF